MCFAFCRLTPSWKEDNKVVLSLANTKLDQGKYYLPQQHFLFEESDKFVWVLKAEKSRNYKSRALWWNWMKRKAVLRSLGKQQTYFQKLEEIIRDLPEVARIWSSWDSDRSHQPFHWSFFLDFQGCTENKRQALFALSLPGVWEPREMHANNDRNTLWVILREPRAPPARSPIYFLDVSSIRFSHCSQKRMKILS